MDDDLPTFMGVSRSNGLIVMHRLDFAHSFFLTGWNNFSELGKISVGRSVLVFILFDHEITWG